MLVTHIREIEETEERVPGERHDGQVGDAKRGGHEGEVDGLEERPVTPVSQIGLREEELDVLFCAGHVAGLQEARSWGNKKTTFT